MQIPDEFSHIFDRLDKVRASACGTFWKARCPSHDDRHPSLAVRIGRTGNLVVKCHANRGCTFESIVQSLGLQRKDFFRKDDHTHRRRKMSKIVRAYPYQDAAGVTRYENVRFEPKDFRMRRPDPDRPGKHLWDMNGVEKVLYRLPRLLRQPAGRTIFVVEGEKTVERMESQLKLAATCNVGGAGKWLPQYTETLRGRPVVILPDYDPVSEETGVRPGTEHARKVANNLYGVAASVKVVWLPGLGEGEDVDDWLDHFGEDADPRAVIAELKRLVGETPEWTPRVRDDDFDLPMFLRVVMATARGVRAKDGRLVTGPLEASGKLSVLARSFVSMVSRDEPPARLLAQLGAIAAFCQLAAEDMNFVDRSLTEAYATGFGDQLRASLEAKPRRESAAG